MVPPVLSLSVSVAAAASVVVITNPVRILFTPDVPAVIIVVSTVEAEIVVT
jgi:hypothetical protein